MSKSKRTIMALFTLAVLPAGTGQGTVVAALRTCSAFRDLTPPAPLFRDPVYDGAADPSLIWNERERSWWVFYTNR